MVFRSNCEVALCLYLSPDRLHVSTAACLALVAFYVLCFSQEMNSFTANGWLSKRRSLVFSYPQNIQFLSSSCTTNNATESQTWIRPWEDVSSTSVSPVSLSWTSPFLTALNPAHCGRWLVLETPPFPGQSPPEFYYWKVLRSIWTKAFQLQYNCNIFCYLVHGQGNLNNFFFSEGAFHVFEDHCAAFSPCSFTAAKEAAQFL